MYIKFLNSNAPVECTVVPNGNIVTLKFADNIVVNTNGFHAYLDAECQYDIAGDSYVDFTTIYRNDEETAKYNGYQLSNDESIWTRPLYTTKFVPGNGGYLKGRTEQKVYTFEDLIVPVPVADIDYDFSHWSPDIPLSGEIGGDRTYTAIFESSVEPEEPSNPTSSIEDDVAALKESVSTLENDVKAINSALGGTVDE